MNAYLGQLKQVGHGPLPGGGPPDPARRTWAAWASWRRRPSRRSSRSTASPSGRALRWPRPRRPRARRGRGRAAAGDSAAVAGHALQGLKRVGLLLERLEAQGGLTITGAAAGAGAPHGGTSRGGVRGAGLRRAQLAVRAKSSSRRSRASRPSGSRRERATSSARSPSRCRAGSLPSASAGGGRAPVLRGRGDRRDAAHHHRPPRTRSRRRAAFTRWSRRASTGSTRARCRRPSRCWSSPSGSSPRRRWTRAAPRSPAASSARRSTGNSSRSSPSRRPTRRSLRKVLQFFTALQVEGLLDTLPGEPKRDRRRLMLLLLEIHGAPARHGSYERLTRSLGPQVGEEEWFFRRNLLYLLRRIPRGRRQPADRRRDRPGPSALRASGCRSSSSRRRSRRSASSRTRRPKSAWRR